MGIRFKHHDALEDSIACAKVLLAAGIHKRAETLEQLESKLRLSRGKLSRTGFVGPENKRRAARKPKRKPAASKSSGPAQLPLPLGDVDRIPAQIFPHASSVPIQKSVAIDIQRMLVRADFTRPLAGKQIVVCGRLKLLTPEHAQQLVVRSGGTLQSEPSDATNLLLVGEESSDVPSIGDLPTVSEREFVSMFGS